MTSRTGAEVVVIGGGIVGCLIVYDTAKAGMGCMRIKTWGCKW